MNPEIKARWLADLKSGNFYRAVSSLSVDSNHTPTGKRHCCLGVLAEIAVADGVVDSVESAAHSQGEYLNNAVCEWAGLPLEPNDNVPHGDSHQAKLAARNDNVPNADADVLVYPQSVIDYITNEL